MQNTEPFKNCKPLQSHTSPLLLLSSLHSLQALKFLYPCYAARSQFWPFWIFTSRKYRYIQIVYCFLSFLCTNITILPCHPASAGNPETQQCGIEVSAEPGSNMEMKWIRSHYKLKWLIKTLLCTEATFETASGHSISFPLEFTVKQNPFLFTSDVLKGDRNL